MWTHSRHFSENQFHDHMVNLVNGHVRSLPSATGPSHTMTIKKVSLVWTPHYSGHIRKVSLYCFIQRCLDVQDMVTFPYDISIVIVYSAIDQLDPFPFHSSGPLLYILYWFLMSTAWKHGQLKGTWSGNLGGELTWILSSFSPGQIASTQTALNDL